MLQITKKDFEGYVVKNELASTPTSQGQVRLEVHVNPLEDTMRYVIVLKDRTSRAMKKFSYAIDMFNNIEDHLGENGEFDKIDSMILSANRFA